MIPRPKILVVLFFAAVCATPVVSRYLHPMREDVRPVDLYNVIYSQLTAFRTENYSLAYSQASYGLQQKFNAGQFETMIREDYSDITQAETIEFGLVKCRDQHASIQVFFIGHDGSVVPCIYSLIYEDDTWKIEGARMLPRQSPGEQADGLRV